MPDDEVFLDTLPVAVVGRSEDAADSDSFVELPPLVTCFRLCLTGTPGIGSPTLGKRTGCVALNDAAVAGSATEAAAGHKHGPGP